MGLSSFKTEKRPRSVDKGRGKGEWDGEGVRERKGVRAVGFPYLIKC